MPIKNALIAGPGYYQDAAVQPVEFVVANRIPFLEGCAIKYLSRHERKGGLKDILKAIHFCAMIAAEHYDADVTQLIDAVTAMMADCEARAREDAE